LEAKGALKEIPRAQRWAHRLGLKSLFTARVRQDKPARDAAMSQACVDYGYTMEVVAGEAGVHCSTVSKVIKEEDERRDIETCPLFRRGSFSAIS